MKVDENTGTTVCLSSFFIKVAVNLTLLSLLGRKEVINNKCSISSFVYQLR